jgi:hypothetical protein
LSSLNNSGKWKKLGDILHHNQTEGIPSPGASRAASITFSLDVEGRDDNLEEIEENLIDDRRDSKDRRDEEVLR